MELHFFLTREDLWHYNIYVYTHQHRRALGIMILLYAFLILFAFLHFQSLNPFSLIYLLLIIVYPLIIVFRIRRTASQGAGYGGEHIVSIMPEGMKEKTNQGEGIRNWNAVKTIAQDKYSLYFVVNSSSSNIVMARIIPKRAFATPQDTEMFLHQARQYWALEQQMRLR